ncbi:MAG: SMP-30/gluconolactonase/LRE family protein [Acidimicrobiales bacterium]|jgi:gluconolactonase|nr:SMP-30/gluconolactonase/LRE family protein [Acidimicrobiales bacterium]
MPDRLPTAGDATTLATGLRFPEGPVALADGSTILTEIAGACVTRIGPDGTPAHVADVPGGPNGLAVAGDTLLVCNNGGFFVFTETDGLTVPGHGNEAWRGGSIDRVDPSTGALEALYTHCHGDRLQAPNDLVLDGAGGFWFTDHGVRADGSAGGGAAGVHWAAVDGSAIRPAAFGVDAPNGIGLSPDATVLHVAETYAGRVWSWPVVGPGELGRHPDAHPDAPHGGRLLYDAPDGHLFDSLAVDAGGFVVVGTLGAGGLTVIDPDGGGGVHIPLDDPLVTNVCFGGPDGRTAHCTGSGWGTLFTLPWPRPGAPLHT